MPQVGDLIQLTQCSNLFSKDACNVFYFVVAAWTGNVSINQVITKFKESHWAHVGSGMSNQLTGRDFTWRNLDNTAEVVVAPNNVNGSIVGDMMPPFVAISIRLNGETNETRSGWKRLPAVPEADAVGGVLTTGKQADWLNIANLLMKDITLPESAEPGTDAWLIPTIVGRNEDGSFDFTRAQPISSWAVQPRVTSQNTRKTNRGS